MIWIFFFFFFFFSYFWQSESAAPPFLEISFSFDVASCRRWLSHLPEWIEAFPLLSFWTPPPFVRISLLSFVPDFFFLMYLDRGSSFSGLEDFTSALPSPFLAPYLIFLLFRPFRSSKHSLCRQLQRRFLPKSMDNHSRLFFPWCVFLFPSVTTVFAGLPPFP